MPPPSWAKRATKLAPKPKPTMSEGVSADDCVRPPKSKKSTETPSKERATTRKPETAPPRREVTRASPRLCLAALAVRLLVCTATDIPMKPEIPEQRAPTRKATEVCQARLILSACDP